MTSSFRHWKKESESFEETNLKQILKMKIILKNNFEIQNKGVGEKIFPKILGGNEMEYSSRYYNWME